MSYLLAGTPGCVGEGHPKPGPSSLEAGCLDCLPVQLLAEASPVFTALLYISISLSAPAPLPGLSVTRDLLDQRNKTSILVSRVYHI